MPDINANTESVMVNIELKGRKGYPSNRQQIDAVRSSAKVKLYGFLRSQLWLLPALAGLTIILLFLVVYPMAVTSEGLVVVKMEPILPYISDAGSFGSQASLFTLLMNIIATLTALSAFVRYKQLKYYFQVVMLPKVGLTTTSTVSTDEQIALIRRLNNVNFGSLILAFFGVFGASLVANFRSSEWVWVHTKGAFFIFFGIYGYAWIMVWMSKKVAEETGLETKPVSMAVFLVIGTVAYVVCMVALVVSIIVCCNLKEFLAAMLRLTWRSKSPGFWWHVVSAGTEWVVFLVISLVLFSLANRMRLFKSWGSVRFSV